VSRELEGFLFIKGVRMKNTLCFGAILLFAVSLSLTLAPERTAAQGPAGVGASAAAQDSSHSMNPIKWIKKDSDNPANAPVNRGEAEKKLTLLLQTQGVLAAKSTATEACSSFIMLDACLAALHASHNLGLDFNCLRAEVTGVHTSADISGCKAADGEKTMDLSKAIHQLKPEANAKQATKEAEQQSKDDLKTIAG
jgi:hypothetical protein